MNVKLLNLKKIALLAVRHSLRWALLITMVLGIIQPTSVYAASLTVDTLDDELNSDGDCSLREAIQAANDNVAVDACPAGEGGSLDEISFAVSGTITLSAQLEVVAGGPLAIDGANAITISGEGSVRVIYLDTGTAVTLENLSILNGAAEGGTPPICSSTYCGGGIYSAGTLALDHVVLADNSAGSGGGIYNGGALTISDSTISGNGVGLGGGIYNSGTLEMTGGIVSDNEGGGIYNSGMLTISNSTLSGNSTYDVGGGISNRGTLTITNSTLFGNEANADGGGIYSSGPLTISDSTVFSNHSQAFGGGISSSGTSTITNSTVFGNDAYRYGGAMRNGGTMTITDSTLHNNGGYSGVGGIFNFGMLTISHSIMQDNYAYGECGGSFNVGALTVTDNSLLAGSGICNVGTAAVSNSTILGSQIFNAESTEVLLHMSPSGPGILTLTNSTLSGSSISNLGTMTVTGTTVSDNYGVQGAGIFNSPYVQVAGYGSSGAGNLTLIDSTVSGNHGHQGGGIFNLGTLDVIRSTLSGNTAINEGGGIYNAQTVEFSGVPISGPGILTLTNSTLSDNSASQSGGIHNSGTLTVRNSTLSGNYTAPYNIDYESRGGNITNEAGTVTLYSSIIANTPSEVNCDGAIIDAGYNIEDADTCSLNSANGSLPNTDPLLGPLSDNGGPTLTHALLPGSPAIDAGDPLHCPFTDQRGVSRPLDGNNDGIAVCDIGAYEAGIVATVDITPNVIRLTGSGQWILAYIELPNGFDVASIDPSTVRLQGAIPAGNPVIKVGDHDKDGIPDILVRFSQQALITELGGVSGQVRLLVTGTLRDGTPFEGWDTIIISQK